jgi:uncharacterized protein (TIGR02266 family)
MPLRVKLLMEFSAERCFLSEFTTYLSAGGMFVDSENPMPPGTGFSFECNLTPEGPRLEGEGQVVWTRKEADEGGPAGMGVRFTELDPDLSELLTHAAQRYQEGGLEAALDAIEAAVPEKVDRDDTDPLLEAPPPPIEDTAVLDARVLLGEASGKEEEPEVPVGEEVAEDREPAAATPAPEEPVPVTFVRRPTATGTASRSRPAEPLEDTIDHPGPVRLTARRSRVIAALVLGGAAVVIALLLGSVGAGTDAELAKLTRGMSPDARSFDRIPADRVREPLPEEQKPAEETSEVPGAAGTAPAITPSTAEAVGPRSAGPPPASGPSFGQVEAIDWRQVGRQLVITVRTDGFLPVDGYRHRRLDDPPREVVDLTGAARPYAERTITVSSEMVSQIRTGFSRSAKRQRLILDLADDSVILSTMENDGSNLRLYLEREVPEAPSASEPEGASEP